MSNVIFGNQIGGAAPLKTLIMQDEQGAEFVGVVTGSEVIFTADPKTDIRDGKTAVTDEGVVTGEKFIPSYETTQKTELVLAGEAYSIKLSTSDRYDYTKFQCIITKYDDDPTKRMTADKVVIDDNVYAVGSSDILSSVTKNVDTKSIDLNIINDTEDIYMMRFVTYKET